MNKTLKSIIVDDESSGRNILRQLLEINCPNVEILALCSSVDEAVQVIGKANVNLVFLDIEMPGKSGIDFLNSFSEIDFQVIFVTAYDKYAVQAIRLNALDYLLKPVRAEDLVKAVEKVKDISLKKNSLLLSNFKDNYAKLEKLAVPIREGFSFVDLNDIIRCEADTNYSLIFLKESKKITSSKTLGEYDDILENLGFIRIHKSHLINLKYIKTYAKGGGGFITMTDGSKIPISRRKREEFLTRMNLFK